MNLSRFGKGMFRTLSLLRDQAYSFHPRDVLSGGKDDHEQSELENRALEVLSN